MHVPRPSLVAISRRSAALGALGALFAAVARVARAAQPGAAAPIAAPMRNLTWGQLNFLHTTDTHGWLSGHLQEPQYSADWGDYLSFAQHMRRRADDAGADLLVIDTGDRVEGSGLYDASVPKGLFHYDFFARDQHMDVICIGNHELYKAYSALRERNTTVPQFPHAYVASNVNYTDPATGKSEPLAPRYRKFKTKNLGLSVVAFGFLFDFTGNAPNTVVQPVHKAIQELWFQEAMREKPDLFLVAAHVGLRMPELRALFVAMREQNWHIPIFFFGGHVHVRDALSYDSASFAMASGRYLETIGWMSVDGIKPGPSPAPVPAPAASLSFSRKYIDSNLLGMYHHTGLNETTFPTADGRDVSRMIAGARRALDLDRRHGCAPRDLWTDRAPYPGNASIYSWLETEVLPAVVVNETRRDKARLAILNTGGVRFDIFKGPFTRDNAFSVSPFANSLRFVPDVPYPIAQKVLGILNTTDKVLARPDAAAAATPDARPIGGPNQPAAPADPRAAVADPPRGGGGDDSSCRPGLLAGYMTKDDMGDDGDDTVRAPMARHPLPNCIQAEIGFPTGGAAPDAVDVVFVDFLQPWVVSALKFSGGDYGDADVDVYARETLTLKMTRWTEDNWTGDC